MATLMLCAAGPMQSWGTTATHDVRGTGPRPTLSGVIGMLSAALGLPRHHATGWIPTDGALRFAVRTDRPGGVLTDYHTVNGDLPPHRQLRKYKGTAHDDTVLTWRDYLTDAAFLIGLEHPDTDLITRLAHATQNPVWTPSLGRRACPPSLPIHIGTTHHPLTDELWESLPLLRRQPRTRDGGIPVTIRATAHPSETPDYYDPDQPVRFSVRDPAHDLRPVTERTLTYTPAQCAGTGLTAHHAITTALTGL